MELTGPYLQVKNSFHPGFEKWVADEICYVLIISSPLKVIFEATPSDAEKIRGELPSEIEGGMLLVNREYGWSICLTEDNATSCSRAKKLIIVAGEPVIKRMKQQIKNLTLST